MSSCCNKHPWFRAETNEEEANCESSHRNSLQSGTVRGRHGAPSAAFTPNPSPETKELSSWSSLVSWGKDTAITAPEPGELIVLAEKISCTL